jgi:serine/threonine protein kinase
MSQAPDDDDERTIVRPASRTGGQGPPGTQLGHQLPVGTQLRDYEITGLIGEGGFGIVYLAYDHSLERRVAIKEYMPSSMAARVNASMTVVVKSERHQETFKAGLKSFVNEAKLLARFDHTALVKVYRFWEEHGTAYMVMPFYEGPTLKAALASMGRPPDEAALRTWLHPLLDALGTMHAAQCYHRDIAPDNILLTATGPLLLDFGAARRVIGDMTHALTVVLKPGYAPIEQYGDVATMTQGAWTDLYALACVVYFAVTGKVPMSSVERLMDDRLEPLSRLAAGRYSPSFLGAIDAALAVRPQDRPQSEAQFRELLDGPGAAAPRSGFGTLAPDDPVTRIVANPRTATARPTTAGPTSAPRTLPMPTASPQPTLPPRRTTQPTAAFGAAPVDAGPTTGTRTSGGPAAATAPEGQWPVRAASADNDFGTYAPLARDAQDTWDSRHSQDSRDFGDSQASRDFTDAVDSPGDAAAAPFVAHAAAAPRARANRSAVYLGGAALGLVAIGTSVFFFLAERRAPATEPATVAASAPTAAPASAAPPIVATPAPIPTAPPAATAIEAAPPAVVEAAPLLPAPAAAPRETSSTTAGAEPKPAPREAAAEAARSRASPPRREAPAEPGPTRPARAEPAPDAQPTAPPVRSAANPSRCSDILQKASLEPLSADEAAFLKRECR